MILVTCALTAESSGLVALLRAKQRVGTTIKGVLELQAPDEDLRALHITVVHTGVGAKECEKRLREFLREEKPEILIASGFCGATQDSVKLGRIVLAENFSTPRLLDKARETLADAITGRLFSSDQIVDRAADRYAIGRKHNAVAIDMETETIAKICAEEALEMLALRGVSDSPAAPFPAPPAVLFDVEAQRTKATQLLPHLVRNPQSAVQLIRFAKQVALAGESLAKALRAVIGAL